MNKHRTRGFTLIELSIVLVIIGLIIGGILVGRDLIVAAATRAQVAQIESYQSAINTFHSKYGYLPGDIPNPDAFRFGFATRGSYAGQGDGNGYIEGNGVNAPNKQDLWNIAAGESPMVWVDLSKAGLIAGSFTTASPNTMPTNPITGSAIDLYIPQGKIGKGNYVYVWAGGWKGCFSNQQGSVGDGLNYFGLSAVTGIANISTGGEAYDNVNITPKEAYMMDAKIDDGLPQTGNVTALAPLDIAAATCWVAGAGNQGAEDATIGGPTNTATSGSATTCYDNNNGSGAQRYSLTTNGGNNPNCALSFRFQ